jgi:hypothetical protein
MLPPPNPLNKLIIGRLCHIALKEDKTIAVWLARHLLSLCRKSNIQKEGGGRARLQVYRIKGIEMVLEPKYSVGLHSEKKHIFFTTD